MDYLSDNIPEHYRGCHGDGCDYEERNVLEDINGRGWLGGLLFLPLKFHLLGNPLLFLGNVAVHNEDFLRVLLQGLGKLAVRWELEKLRRHEDMVIRERRPGGDSVGGHDGVVILETLQVILETLETLEIFIIARRRRRQIVAGHHFWGLIVICVQGELEGG